MCIRDRFKIATDPFVGRLAFFRCYSGKVDAGSYVQNMRTGKKERISRIFQMHSNKQNPVDVIEAGDIGAAVGFKDIRTGDTLCDESKQIILESMSFPEPVIGIAIEPKTQADLDKMGQALAKLAEDCLLYTSDAADERSSVDLGGRRIINKKKQLSNRLYRLDPTTKIVRTTHL